MIRASGRDRRAAGRDDGALRLATVTRLFAFLAIVGVFGFDGFALMSNHVKAENDAQNAAYAASQAYYQTKSLPDAYQAAVQSVAGTPDKVLTSDFTVDPDGTIHLLVQRTVNTIVLKHIGPWKKYTTTIQHGDANYADD